MPTWRAPGEHVERGVVPPPTANQGCSSAQWVLEYPWRSLREDMTKAVVIFPLKLLHGHPLGTATAGVGQEPLKEPHLG